MSSEYIMRSSECTRRRHQERCMGVYAKWRFVHW